MALPLLPLSNNASTASWSILFSFLTIMSGAFNSKSLLSLLFLFITLLYKSFKSDVANLPPSSGTRGLKSGGNTGRALSIIHWGLFPDLTKYSTSFSLLVSLFILASDFVEFSSSRSLIVSWFRSRASSISKIASAPILATNSSPYCSIAS